MPTKATSESRKKAKHCTMDSISLKQIPKFSRKRKHFPVWLTTATDVWALNGVSAVLKLGLPANDAIPLDKTKAQ
jgi:hypothetical protein